MPEYTFELVRGTHQEGTARGLKRLEPGAIIKTGRPLDEIFPNKFRRVTVKGLPEDDTDADVEEVAVKFKMVHVGRGKYHVVNSSTGERINDKLLPKSQAEEMVLELNS